MEAAYDRYIQILNDPKDPLHEKVSRIMNTNYDLEEEFSNDMFIQSGIRRRLKEIEADRVKKEKKRIEDERKQRFEQLIGFDLDADSDKFEAEVYTIIDEWLNDMYDDDFATRSFAYELRFEFYIRIIGWAIPSRRNIGELYGVFSEHLKTHPEAKLIDWGCGTGIWSFLLQKKGIPAKNIVAVDNYETDSYTKTFYPIVAKVDSFSEDDILFVAWGRTSEFIQKFIDSGGTCVIIVGENDDGCTLSSQWFEGLDGWVVEERQVDGGARKFDYMSINRKI